MSEAWGYDDPLDVEGYRRWGPWRRKWAWRPVKLHFGKWIWGKAYLSAVFVATNDNDWGVMLRTMAKALDQTAEDVGERSRRKSS